MKAKEIAIILKVHKSTVKRWIKRGYIKGSIEQPKKGKGGHEFWSATKEEIDNYLKKLN